MPNPLDILTLPPPPADARLYYGGEPLQFADLRLPKAAGFWHQLGNVRSHPVVMNIHGGFWRNKYDLLHAGHLCAALTAQGFATWNIEYRRVGDPGGGWPGSFTDVRAAFAMLPHIADKYHFDMTRVVVMGHSAGGQLAVCLAGHEPLVTRVVSLAGVLDLMRAHELGLSDDAVGEFLGGSPQQVPDNYRDADPMQLKIPQALQVIIQGTDDDVIPAEIAHRYVDAKRAALSGKENVELIEIKAAGHFDLIDPHSEAWKQVAAVVREMVAGQ